MRQSGFVSQSSATRNWDSEVTPQVARIYALFRPSYKTTRALTAAAIWGDRPMLGLAVPPTHIARADDVIESRCFLQCEMLLLAFGRHGGPDAAESIHDCGFRPQDVLRMPPPGRAYSLLKVPLVVMRR